MWFEDSKMAKFDLSLLIFRLGKVVCETSLAVARFGPDYLVQIGLSYLHHHVYMKGTASDSQPRHYDSRPRSCDSQP